MKRKEYFWADCHGYRLFSTEEDLVSELANSYFIINVAYKQDLQV